MSDIAGTSSGAVGRTRQRAPRVPERRLQYSDEEIEILPENEPAEVMGDGRVSHIILRFALGTQEFDSYQRYRRMTLLGHGTFDWDLIDAVGRGDEIRPLLGDRWAHALSCEAPQYVELTQEFFSTMRYTTGAFAEERAVSFSLGRELHQISVPEFAVATGLYTQEPKFAASLRGYTAAARPSPQMVTSGVLSGFWEQEIGADQHTSSAVESSICDPVHRYIRRIIGTTLFGRLHDQEKCSNTDLLCLYSIIGRHECHTPVYGPGV